MIYEKLAGGTQVCSYYLSPLLLTPDTEQQHKLPMWSFISGNKDNEGVQVIIEFDVTASVFGSNPSDGLNREQSGAPKKVFLAKCKSFGWLQYIRQGMWDA